MQAHRVNVRRVAGGGSGRAVARAAAVLALAAVAAAAAPPARVGRALGAAARAAALSGLYLQNQSIGRGDVWNYYYFWPDGHVCHAMPKGGMDPAPSYAAVAQQAPAECGTYALGGGHLVLALGGRPAEALDYSNPDPTGFALSQFPTIRIPAFPAGARLNGRWQMMDVRTADYREEVFTFNPDGTFAIDDRPVLTSGSPARHAAGTYTLGGNTMQLSTGARLSVHRFPAAGDRRLGIEGSILQPR